MAEVPNPKWYDEGTIALTQGSPEVTGTGTFWVSAGVKVGDIFVDSNGMIYEITAVNDSTSLTLGKNYAGTTGSGKGYSIIRVFNSTTNATLANRISKLLSEFEQRYDLDMQTITPKSAYDIAKDNGYTGTITEWLESLSAYGVAVQNGYTGTITEWLESLKAAGEWTAANSRLTQLEGYVKIGSNVASHNQIYRGKDLGTSITDAQRAAIKADDWSDLCIGDFWTINRHKYIIVQFNGHIYGSTDRGIMIMAHAIKTDAVMNETATNAGGYYNSYMHQTYLPEVVLPIIQADWGDLMHNFYDRYPNTNASSLSLGCVKFPSTKNESNKGYLMLPTYRMFKGYPYSAYPQDCENLHVVGLLPFCRLADTFTVLSSYVPGWVQDCADDTSKFMYIWWAGSTPTKGVDANVAGSISPLFFVS